jgi:hypothetical protein
MRLSGTIIHLSPTGTRHITNFHHLRAAGSSDLSMSSNFYGDQLPLAVPQIAPVSLVSAALATLQGGMGCCVAFLAAVQDSSLGTSSEITSRATSASAQHATELKVFSTGAEAPGNTSRE